MISKENLDKRICDIEPNATNTETYREFLVRSAKEFYIDYIPDFDIMTDEDLKVYLDEYDYLWDK